MVHKVIISSFRRHQIVRFMIVGIFNTAFSYGIYAGLIFLGAHYALANLIALVMGILFSFKTQGYLVFKNTDNRLLGRFVLSWGLIYLATITLIGQCIRLGLDAYIAGIVAIPFSTALSYLTQKFYVFRPGESKVLSADKIVPEKRR